MTFFEENVLYIFTVYLVPLDLSQTEKKEYNKNRLWPQSNEDSRKAQKTRTATKTTDKHQEQTRAHEENLLLEPVGQNFLLESMDPRTRTKNFEQWNIEYKQFLTDQLRQLGAQDEKAASSSNQTEKNENKTEEQE